MTKQYLNEFIADNYLEVTKVKEEYILHVSKYSASEFLEMIAKYSIHEPTDIKLMGGELKVPLTELCEYYGFSAADFYEELYP